jgi:6-pyruvoyltetrahydropterin/6-carboxytetrahydropterin synthase
MASAQRYSVVVSKDYLKFAAAHVIAFPGFREPLHGHNYQVSVAGEADLGPDGYVLEFGLVKRGREGALRGGAPRPHRPL